MTEHLVPIAAAAVRVRTDEAAALEKQRTLLASLRALDSLLIALSGGADSAYLAWAAHSALGERALSITALSASFSQHDRQQAIDFVRSLGVRHEFIETREFENPAYVANSADRCYHCKDELFDRMELLARERGFSAIAYGINADDTRDFRPGHRAAHEHRILAPLLDAKLSKARNSHALATCRTFHMGPASVGMPFIAHSLWSRGHARTACQNRTRRSRPA